MLSDFSRTARLAKETPPRFAPKTPSWPLAPYAAMVSTTRFALLALVAISLLAAPPGCSAARALRQSDDAELAITADAAPEQFSFWSTSIDSVYDKGSNHAAPRLKDHHDALHRTAHGWIEGFVPKSYSPFVATVISYALLVLPFLAAYNLFSAMGHMLSLQKLLMAINIYNATYCALLVVFNLWTGNEPMASLQESNEADYLILQFAKVVAYLGFVLIQCVHVGLLLKTKAENMKVAAVGNLLLSLCIGFHYYLRVWGPAMEGHPPRTSQLSYMLYTVLFLVMAFSHYVKPDKGERAEAAAAENIMGGDENKQF